MLSHTSQPPRSRSTHRKTAQRETLRERTRRVLSQEIAFVPSGSFREMDADRTWHDELAKMEDQLANGVWSTTANSAMPAHLAKICAAPLLTAHEEQRLFCGMNYLKYRANSIRVTLDADHPNLRKLNEIKRQLALADRLRNRIVNSNTRLAVSIVKKFADDRNPFDDLLSEGISSLLRATEKFDFERGFRFSTYATLAVRREVYRMIQRTHRDRVRFATGALEVFEEQGVAEEPTERTESALIQINNGIARMLSRLDEREQFIVKARYGLIDLGVKPTFSRLGERLGVSKERVRQLEIRAMNKLRHLVGELRLAELGGLV